MNCDVEEIEDQALTWVVRVRDQDFSDWEALEEWLAAAPRHLEAYQQMSNEDRDLELLIAPRRPAMVDRAKPAPTWFRRRYLGGMAVAASALALLSFPLLRPDPMYELITAPGEQRQVELEGGTVIRLNGSTKLTLDRRDARFAALKHGEALFQVRHDETNPFTVHLGETRLVDLGTLFNVVRTTGAAGVTDVAVAEGAVRYVAAREQVSLTAGQRLRVEDASGIATRSSIAPALVGAWQQGRFVYSGEPLSQVASDLTRYVGTPVRVDRDLANEPFTGVISVTNPKDLQPLAPLFHARVLREGDHWRITRS